MPARKSETPQSPSRHAARDVTAEVPAALVAGVLVWLLAIFVPLVSLGPDLPDALPPLAYRPAAVMALHGDRVLHRVPDYLDGYFTQLARALDAHDPAAVALAQRDFASFLVDATGSDPSARLDAREHHLRGFLRTLDAGESAPMSGVAARHGLAGPDAPPWIQRAMLIAWFDLRWEAAGARENLRGDGLPLARLLARIPAEEARAHVAWALAADCGALLGLGARVRSSAPQHVRCAQIREAYLDAAATLEGSYPLDEARAAAQVLLARGLDHAARRERDPARRDETLARAREALDRAHEDYTVLVERAGDDRRIARYLLGTARALAAD